MKREFKRKIIFILIIAIILSSYVYNSPLCLNLNDGKRMFIIVELDRSEEVLKKEAEKITKYFNDHLKKACNINTIHGDDLYKKIESVGIPFPKDLHVDSNAVKVGKLLNADFVVTGKISKIELDLVLTVRKIDVNIFPNCNYVNSFTVKMREQNIKNFMKKRIPELINKICKDIIWKNH